MHQQQQLIKQAGCCGLMWCVCGWLLVGVGFGVGEVCLEGCRYGCYIWPGITSSVVWALANVPLLFKIPQAQHACAFQRMGAREGVSVICCVRCLREGCRRCAVAAVKQDSWVCSCRLTSPWACI